MRTSRQPRGAAMITVMMLMTVLAAIVASVIAIAGAERTRIALSARSIQRQTCAEDGLQFARSFFANRQAQWDLVLLKPGGIHPYNPVASYWNTNPAVPTTSLGRSAIKAITTPVPGTALFVDLDGDTQDDVYIYMRDNDDEVFPANSNWGVDNDQNVIVGAMCISNTMVPRRPDGTVEGDRVTVESVLSFNALTNIISSQSGQGPSGSGNIN
jgi:hypothetical protein